MKKILLITGASGFIGTWLADTAYNLGYDLIGVDMRSPFRPSIWASFITSSCENVDWDNLLNGKKLFAVCHLAGGASVAASVQDPYSDFSNLLPGTAKLATYISKFHSEARFYLFSSAAVYGNPDSLPINESDLILPISPYGVHKSIAESILLHYSRIFNLKVTIFRIFSVYGPGLRKQLIWDVANKAIAASSRGAKTIKLFGTGNETRDFIYIEDICTAVMLLLESDLTSNAEVYNLASGIESTISETATCLIKHLGYNLEIEFDGNIPNGDPCNWQSNISRISNIGFKPNYNLDAGLHNVAHWIKK